MQTKLLGIFIALMLGLGLAVGMMMALPVAAAVPTSLTTWVDNFDAPTLNARWSWVREDPSHWSLTPIQGSLRITTEEGGIWGGMNNQKNLLLMAAPVGNFTVTTKVNFTPTSFIHNAGLIVYQDDDNYVQLNRQFTADNVVEIIKETAASPTFTAVSEAATLVYLRLQRLGGVYTGYYSLNGTNWTQVGQYTANLTNAKVGLGASNELPSLSEIPADFDYFQLDDASYNVFLPLVVR